MKHYITQVRHGFVDPLFGPGWSFILSCTCGWKTSHEDSTAVQMVQKRNHCNENGC